MRAVPGVNHQFLWPEAMTDADAHTRTLRGASELIGVDALDCWVWRGEERSREEIRILRDSWKIIHYNIGDRFGEEICRPASPVKSEREHAWSCIMRELSFALELGSKKIVFAGGPDYPDDRDSAKERLAEFVRNMACQLPPDVTLALEPTDRDMDKYFLFGPVEETADFIRALRDRGINIGMLLDMGHIPLMHESLASAVEKAGDTLVHIHLGNCLLSDPTHPLYGDRHVPWDAAGSEYTGEDGVRYLRILRGAGYFAHENATASFEMRPIPGKSAEESLAEWIKIWKRGMADD